MERRLSISTQGLSRYIQTTWRLSAKSTLKLPDMITSIRLFSEEEAHNLAELARKRNVFARHSRESGFYVQRIRALANRTVIEVFRPGDPDDMSAEAQKVADLTEKLALLSSTLAMPREKLQRLLAISSHRRSEFDITIGRGFYYLRSKSRPEPITQGITIDERFCRRFERCGFPQLALLCVSRRDVANRVVLALDWLFESRQEPVLPAALVKTSIALESLLIFSESEPLARSLSERAAFILSSDAHTRKEVSRIVKRFYGVRSGVVHGSRKKAKKLTPSLVEGIDRLTVLLCLIIASNSDKWDSTNSLRDWCEYERWGTPTSDVRIPFPDSYLRNAVTLCLKDVV